MPIYTYTCSGCGRETDELRRMSVRNEPATCPDCGDLMERKVPVRTGRPKFKGTGFYATDSDTDHPWRLDGVDDHPPENLADYDNLDEGEH